MGLVLGLKIGEEVYLNDTPVRLDAIYSGQHVLLMNTATGKAHEVGTGRSTEILPNVFFSMGDRCTTVMSRISITAPSTVKILTGTKYRQLHQMGETVRPPTGGASKEYKVRANLFDQARKLGIENVERVQEMLRLSAPISMPGYNRRHETYVFSIDGNAVVGIDRLTSDQQAYYDSRNYEERVTIRDVG